MRMLRDLSIRYKLTLMLVGVVSVLLLGVSVANVICDVQNTRASMVTKYTSLAKIVAAQSGAALSIADIDASGAQEIVADLSVEPTIRYASLYGVGSNEIARYSADPTELSRPITPGAPATAFTADGFLEVVQVVRLNEQTVVGWLYLRASTDELRTQVRSTIWIAVVTYIVALLVALLLSLVLQRVISVPILQLAQLTRSVSKEHDYSLVARHGLNDELGSLCDGFNKMLTEIRRRDDDLSRSNDELRQFAFVASHDLQEPLRSVTSFCNLLEVKCRGRVDAQVDDYLDRIVSGAQRMKSLVMDLLDYSRVSREEQPDFHEVELQDVVYDALANLQSKMEETGAEILVEELPKVVGNRQQLVQLMQNLIGNAILYRSERPPRIEVSTARAPSGWEIMVRDNGIGIAPEHFDRIFEIFKRLHNRNEYPGTGIGLAVCRKVVERHGGEIWVESQVNLGSVFHFTLPAIVEESCNEPERIIPAEV